MKPTGDDAEAASEEPQSSERLAEELGGLAAILEARRKPETSQDAAGAPGKAGQETPDDERQA